MALPQACMTRLWSTPTRDRPTKAIAAPAGNLDRDDHLQPRQDLAECGGHQSKRGVGSDVGGEEAAAAEPLRVRRREAAEHEHHLEDAGHPDGRRPDREGDEEGVRRTLQQVRVGVQDRPRPGGRSGVDAIMEGQQPQQPEAAPGQQRDMPQKLGPVRARRAAVRARLWTLSP
jgi:hypothetical protein